MVTMTAIGNIEEVRVNKRNIAKYLIRFKDDNGKIHTTWSNWTTNPDRQFHQPGTSVPIKYRVLPGTCGLGCTITEIDDLPQFNETLAHIGVGSMIVAAAAAGFVLAKLLKKD